MVGKSRFLRRIQRSWPRAALWSAGMLWAAEALARGGGGGGGSGGGGGGGGGHGGGGSGSVSVFALFFAALFTVASAIYARARFARKGRATRAAMARMAKHDAAWSQERLAAFAEQAFMTLQKAWCNFDYETLGRLMEPRLLALWTERLEFLAAHGHRNKLERLTIDEMRFVLANDEPGKDNDHVTVCFDASAIDYTVDAHGTIVATVLPDLFKEANTDKEWTPFREFWTFKRTGELWRLADVQQQDQWERVIDAPNTELDGTAEAAG